MVRHYVIVFMYGHVWMHTRRPGPRADSEAEADGRWQMADAMTSAESSTPNVPRLTLSHSSFCMSAERSRGYDERVDTSTHTYSDRAVAWLGRGLAGLGGGGVHQPASCVYVSRG